MSLHSKLRLQIWQVLFSILLSLTSAYAQTQQGTNEFILSTPPIDWQVVEPDGENFYVVMPAPYTKEIYQVQLGNQVNLSANAYHTLDNGNFYMVLSFESFNVRSGSKIDAFSKLFWNAFLTGSKIEDVNTQVNFDAELTGPVSGRQYVLTMGSNRGITRIYSMPSRFYVLMAFNKFDYRGIGPVMTFQNSFRIGKSQPYSEMCDVIECGLPVMGSLPEPVYPPFPFTSKVIMQLLGGSLVSKSTLNFDRPLKISDLNKRVISKPAPILTNESKESGLSDTVYVSVIVGENGKVVHVSGAVGRYPILREAAKQAAYKAVFLPTVLSGRRIKVRGMLIYQFPLR